MDIEITKMTSRGQIVIPQEIREHKKLKEGEKFLVFDIDDNIVLKRIKGFENTKTVSEFENTFTSMWKTAKKLKITKKEVESEIQRHKNHKIK